MGKNIFYFVIAITVLVLVGGVILFATQQRNSNKEVQPEETLQQTAGEKQQEEGLGSDLNQNPGSKVPETNPLEGYTNPFE